MDSHLVVNIQNLLAMLLYTISYVQVFVCRWLHRQMRVVLEQKYQQWQQCTAVAYVNHMWHITRPSFSHPYVDMYVHYTSTHPSINTQFSNTSYRLVYFQCIRLNKLLQIEFFFLFYYLLSYLFWPNSSTVHCFHRIKIKKSENILKQMLVFL